VLPVWELSFSNLADGAHAIATEKVKHDPIYQEKRGILQGPAENLPPNVVTRIRTLAKRICHTLELDGYCRIDFRLSKDNVPYFIEANPNPEIASSQEYAQAALHAGVSYADLLNKIVAFGLKRAGVEV
jgi:D-alanine-D-alanine ligase